MESFAREQTQSPSSGSTHKPGEPASGWSRPPIVSLHCNPDAAASTDPRFTRKRFGLISEHVRGARFSCANKPNRPEVELDTSDGRGDPVPPPALSDGRPEWTRFRAIEANPGTGHKQLSLKGLRLGRGVVWDDEQTQFARPDSVGRASRSVKFRSRRQCLREATFSGERTQFLGTRPAGRGMPGTRFAFA